MKKEVYNFSFNLKKNVLILNIDQHKEKIKMLNFYNQDISLLSFLKDPGVQIPDYTICSDVSNHCASKTINNCDSCSAGVSYQVVASNCSFGSLRRYCGKKICGKKDAPACYRGRAASGYTGPFCISDSPIAFCEKPLRVICLNDELYCR